MAWLTSELDRPSVGGFFGLEVEGGDNGDIPSVMHWGVSQVRRDAVVSGAAEVVRALATAERSLDAGNTSAAREALVRAEAMSARAGLSAAHSLRLRVAQWSGGGASRPGGATAHRRAGVGCGAGGSAQGLSGV